MSSAKATVYLRGICRFARGLARGVLVRLQRGVRPAYEHRRGAERSAACGRPSTRHAPSLPRSSRRARDSDAEAMLAFQIAMLQDPAAERAGVTAIAAQVPPEQAWQDAMESQIRSTIPPMTRYFRARASRSLRHARSRLGHIVRERRSFPFPGSIVIATDLPPSRFSGDVWDGGASALTEGSANSHVAMLARARGVPDADCLDHGPSAGTRRSAARRGQRCADNVTLCETLTDSLRVNSTENRSGGTERASGAPAVTAGGEHSRS